MQKSIIFLLLMVSACSTQTLKSNDVNGIDSLTMEQKEILLSEKTISLSVERSYKPEKWNNLPIEELIEEIFHHAEITIITENSKPSPVNLKIKVSRKALSANYEDRSTRFSGASISGEIALIVQDKTVYKESFSGVANPKSSVTNRDYKFSSQAPFHLALKNSSFFSNILHIIFNVYGPNPLISLLNDRSASISIAAAEVLCNQKDIDPVPPLIAALEHDSADVRVTVIDALGNKKSKAARLPLQTALVDSNFGRGIRVSSAAAAALGKINDERAVKPLSVALLSPYSDLREVSAWALGEIGGPLAELSLIKALNDKEFSVRVQAAKSLGKIEAKNALEPLISALVYDPGKYLDRDAVQVALNKIDSEWYRSDTAISLVPTFIRKLDHKYDNVREEAAWVLGEIGDSRAVEPLITILLDDDAIDTREQAAISLGKMRDIRAVEPLISVLRKNNPFIHDEAAWALGEINDPRAIEPLINRLRIVDHDARNAAVEALHKITGENFEKDVGKWIKWWKSK